MVNTGVLANFSCNIFSIVWREKMTADGKLDQRETPPLNAVHQQPQEALELVSSGPDQKNWRGIGIALLVIILVCGLIVAAIVLLTPGDKGFNARKTRLSLDEVIKGKFSYRRFNGSWISDYEFIYRDQYGAIGLYDVRNKSKEVLMPNTTLRQHSISFFYLSPDRQYILLYHDYEKVFRYTYKSMFLLYNITGDHLTGLLPKKSDMWFQYAAWGPTGSQLVYIYGNNIYYMPDISSAPIQLTSSGVEGIIFNGIPDWVYEEEILSSSNALWWSPDGTKLCFATFNDSDVDILQYPYYGSYAKIENVYPEYLHLRYPKAGRTNPKVTMHIADLVSTKDLIVVEPPKEYRDIDYYFTDVQWVDNSAVSIVWLKRSQNSSVVSLCQENDGWTCKKNFQVDSHGHGWVELSKAVFSADAKTYFLRIPGLPEGNLGRFKHIAAVDVKSGADSFLTSGKYDTVALLGHNLEKRTLYYISTREGKPGERHIYAVTDKHHRNPKNVTCLTCDVGPDCLFNDATFSPGYTYYVLECLGPGIPRIELRVTETNEIVSVLDTNDELRELVEDRAMPKVKTFKVPLDGNYHANVRLYLPPHLQEYEITKYPLFVQVYGGPGSQMVNERFNVNWGSFLASKKNIIYAQIDGRGSGFQGDKFLHQLYLKLGTVEVMDQLTVASHLKSTLPYIDGKHVAIFGWSYGGYVSALALASEENVFTCGISVAPVTSWLYYDSVYTERYMRMPTSSDNLINYEKSDVMKRALNFKGKKYLLVHGTADDNVHWQQSMMLAKSLTDAGVLFRMQVYPDENHALGHVKLHLYQTMDDFLDQCLSDNYKDDASYHSTLQDSER